MNTLVLESDPLAIGVSITDEELIVDLTDGRRIIVPLAWYPRLLDASPSERGNWKLLADGYAMEWPDLDEHIGIEGLLAGRHSGESQQSLGQWLAKRRAHKKGEKQGKLPPTRPGGRRAVARH